MNAKEKYEAAFSEFKRLHNIYLKTRTQEDGMKMVEASKAQDIAFELYEQSLN